MLLRNSPAKDLQKESPFKGKGIITDSAKERCIFTDPQIDRIRCCFLANTVFNAYDPSALSDHTSDSWVAFPVTPFAIGYTYPFPAFTQAFFSLTGISYIQAMPMIWRVMKRMRRSRCLRVEALARTKVVRQAELVVMVERRIELQDWAMMEISRLSRSPIFFCLVVVCLDSLMVCTLNNSF
ncbi:hypothetical protein HanPI659440_Chr16g0635821 [Helianthus annuus]|nr:hypothetical protein HanPI659440_Chr16g0635821 [Helianthus annuus]